MTESLIYHVNVYNDLENRINQRIRETEMRESGWSFVQRLTRTLHITKYKNVGGSYIELSFKSPFIINIQININD